MTTGIHISGLSFICTDEELLQTFAPFGTVMFAQVLRDPLGHSLGLGIVHMSRPEEVEKIFSAQQRFEVAGMHVDIWEPSDPHDKQSGRTVSYNYRSTPAARPVLDTRTAPGQKSPSFLARPVRRLIQAIRPIWRSGH